jgi:hypothetical protein
MFTLWKKSMGNIVGHDDGQLEFKSDQKDAYTFYLKYST